MNQSLLITIVLASSVERSTAAQVVASSTWYAQSGGNGHRYELHRVDGGISWTDARDAALAANGHLATCTSAAENAFVFALVDDLEVWTHATNQCSIGPWIGGFQPAGSPEPADGWQWVTGEPWSATNWTVNEPNDSCFGAEEHSLCFWSTPLPTPQTSSTWNDYAVCVGLVRGYVVEYEFSTFCFGDGTAAACPCTNPGSAGRGCGNVVFPQGSSLNAAGSPSVATDSIALTASEMSGATCLYLQGTAQAAAPFGYGIQCVSGTLVRVGLKSIVAGTSTNPSGVDLPISVKGGVPAAGGLRFYQAVYRQALPPCAPTPASLTNRTNGLAIDWQP